jgi:probable HAF family extracellular repeat protein
MRRYSRFLMILGAVLLFVGAIHADPPFHFTSIDYPGAVLTNAQGINPGGDIVGTYVDTSGNQHGFLLSNGKFTSLDYPGGPGTSTFARGISADGDIVGSYSTPPGTPPNIHGFLLSQGNYSEVQFPGHLGTIAQRILPNGDILGCLHDTDLMSTMYGFMRTAAGYASLNVQASMNNGSTPDGNHIVGLYTDMMTGLTHGYMIDYGAFTPFDVPGSNVTNAWDISPAGDIVGAFRDTSGKVHGFLRSSAGDYSTINFPGATLTRAFGINPGGEVVGAYVDSAGVTHGFLLAGD